MKVVRSTVAVVGLFAAIVPGSALAQVVSCPGIDVLNPKTHSAEELVACLIQMNARLESLESSFVPPGTVAAFAHTYKDGEPCPEGWDRYVRGKGRVIVGVGDRFDLGDAGFVNNE